MASPQETGNNQAAAGFHVGARPEDNRTFTPPPPSEVAEPPPLSDITEPSPSVPHRRGMSRRTFLRGAVVLSGLAAVGAYASSGQPASQEPPPPPTQQPLGERLKADLNPEVSKKLEEQAAGTTSSGEFIPQDQMRSFNDLSSVNDVTAPKSK